MAGAAHNWLDALVAVLEGLAAMVIVAALGLWAAGAADLPGNALPRVVAAVVVMAVGGSVDITGGAGFLAETNADLSVLPLSVSLAGALVTAFGFLRPLRHRAIARPRELAARTARMAVLWVAGVLALALVARHTFEIELGDSPASDITDLLDASPTVGFRTDVPLTLIFGLLWLLGVLALALLVSRRAPLPARLVRFQESVRPAAYAMVLLLLTYVVVALVIGLVVAATRGRPAETFAVILLGLPNLAWLALTLGIGGSWEGKLEGPFGLPMPKVLDQVLRTPENSTLSVGTLADYDSRARWLVVVAAVLLLAAAFVMAVRSPARTRSWQHAVHMAVALALTVLMICLTVRVSAHYGLSLLGIGDLDGGLAGEVSLRPHLWRTLGMAVLWGLITGFLGSLMASRVRRRGAVEEPPEPKPPEPKPPEPKPEG
ncbi:streptophobe family protein [Streptomyces sp. A3M-1-3]|uniref:streptophobe family protein n=1 Tax=Streptomyces sp. A3M-1-3 TaxID=2962044 RepID=UPI0020B90121|nr:streptophobe family protein [Streptomyces sp. A3M-1-3]MCP3820620.1 streptophobe family protein [Streptomyces sp. A3M-1-3]